MKSISKIVSNFYGLDDAAIEIIESIFDWLILIVILADLHTFGLAHWLLISFLLLLPFDTFYFFKKKRQRVNQCKKNTKKIEKIMAAIK